MLATLNHPNIAQIHGLEESGGITALVMEPVEGPTLAEDVSDRLAAVLRGEPDWAALPADVPASVRTLIRRCLEKDRKRRIGDISVALFVLDDPASVASATAAPTSSATIAQHASAPQPSSSAGRTRCRPTASGF